MLGKKKKPDPVPVPSEPTQKMEVKITSMDQTKLLEWLFTEYKNSYHGLFGQQDLSEINIEATTLDVLFAIWSELRMMREINSQKGA